MSVAGFDPSGGAGLLADIKTFEQHRTYAFGVMTANTWQNDTEVKEVEWVETTKILKQMDVILDKFQVKGFKIGITKDAEMLESITKHIRQRSEKAFVVWDPVLKAGSGFSLFEKGNIEKPLSEVNLITPNKEEFEILIGTEEKALELSQQTMIYLKGGHDKNNPGKDFLYAKGKKFAFNPQGEKLSAKHGSGCVMASALCANMVLGYPLIKACLRSKRYMEKVLSSNESLLAYHKR